MNREQAIEFKNSLGWTEFEKELRKTEQMHIQALIKCKEPQDTIRLQEKIQAIREVILLPDNLSEREE